MKKDFITELKRKQEHQKEFVEKMTYSTEYMDWLEAFTAKKGSFSTDSFLYDREGLTDKDMEYVEDIQILFEEISGYCEENYIEPKPHDYGVYYSIKNNDVGYHIGFDRGQGACFYCERLAEVEEDALDFKHVRSGVKLPQTVHADFELERLSDLIEELYEAGIPINAISKVTDKTIESLKENNSKERNRRAK